jgi:hypothetical protein
MRSGCENGKAVLGRDLGHRLSQVAQFRVRGADVVMRQRRHLDLRLQKFAHHLAVRGGLGGAQKRLRHGPRHELGLGIDQEVLLFDAKAVFVFHAHRLAPS